MEESDEWYIVIDGEAQGPNTSREIDVKFRTNELVSSTLAWKDGMTEWKPIFEISELKKMLQGKWKYSIYNQFILESTDEIT